MLKETVFVEWPWGRPSIRSRGAKGERNARRFEVYGYVFSARKPLDQTSKG